MDKHINKPLVGICFIIVWSFFVMGMNGFAKLAGETYTASEIVFYRGFILTALIGGYTVATQKLTLLKMNKPYVHMQRAFIGTLSVILVFWSYDLIPLSEATALHLLSGVLTTILAAIFLKEKVGLVRILAVICAFGGAYIIINPNGENFLRVESVVPLASAFTIAIVALYIRRLAKTETSLALVFYFMLFSTLLSGIYVALHHGIEIPTIGYFSLIGVCAFGLAHQFAKARANVYAEASTLSPYTYLVLVWSIIFDVVIWSNWPDSHVWIGSAIIVSSNLIVIWRESRHKKLAS